MRLLLRGSVCDIDIGSKNSYSYIKKKKMDERESSSYVQGSVAYDILMLSHEPHN